MYLRLVPFTVDLQLNLMLTFDGFFSFSFNRAVFTYTLISLPFISQIWSYLSLSPNGIEIEYPNPII